MKKLFEILISITFKSAYFLRIMLYKILQLLLGYRIKIVNDPTEKKEILNYVKATIQESALTVKATVLKKKSTE